MSSTGDPAPDPDTPDGVEVKDKFREALERKRGQEAERHAAQLDDPSKIHGEHGAAGVRRTFRRKSG